MTGKPRRRLTREEAELLLDRANPNRVLQRFIDNREWEELGLCSFSEALDILKLAGMLMTPKARRMVVDQILKERREKEKKR